MNNDKTLTPDELDILRATIGKVVASFESSPMGRNTYYEKVKVLVGRLPIVISNSLEPADVGYESGAATEDAGTMRVVVDDGPLKISDVVAGPANVTIPINSEVVSVEVVNDHVKMMRDGIIANSFSFTQAIIFHLNCGDLVVDRGVWFEVFLNIYVTDDGRRSLRDTGADWGVCDETPYEGVVTRESISL